MRGNNTLHLNEATIIEAMQEYFDKRMTPKIKIKSVKKSSDHLGAGGTFDIDVTDEGAVQ